LKVFSLLFINSYTPLIDALHFCMLDLFRHA
jgi:hypothetical protein